jgi:HEAT repeat protein
MIAELQDKNADIKDIVGKAIENKELFFDLLDGLKSKNETIRYNCSKVLTLITRERAEILYPSWDYLVEFLHSENSYQKMSAANLLANLIKVDDEKKFEEIFDEYFDLLDDKSMILGVYVAQNAAQIVFAKPQMEDRITNRLLNIDKTHHFADRKELIKAGAIESFSKYFEISGFKSEILDFVSDQQNSKSPKLRKLAKQFLQKWKTL